MDRRTFLGWVGVGWLASSLPVALVACSGGNAKGKFKAVGLKAELDQSGSLQNDQFPSGPVVVIEDPQNPEVILAMNSTCPHNECLVNWKKDRKVFVCPCHGSQFAPDGKVLQGPAKQPLVPYAAKVDGDYVVVEEI
jgi:cytochrome b6-f complex iron-sulfur subunit